MLSCGQFGLTHVHHHPRFLIHIQLSYEIFLIVDARLWPIFDLSSCSPWFLIPIQLRRFSSQEMKVLVQRNKSSQDNPFHFPYIHMTLDEAARTLVLGVLGWMTK
jgi:hypothetical protein